MAGVSGTVVAPGSSLNDASSSATKPPPSLPPGVWASAASDRLGLSVGSAGLDRGCPETIKASLPVDRGAGLADEMGWGLAGPPGDAENSTSHCDCITEGGGWGVRCLLGIGDSDVAGASKADLEADLLTAGLRSGENRAPQPLAAGLSGVGGSGSWVEA